MGHYTTSPQRVQLTSPAAPAFNAFRDHCSSKRTYTKLHLLDQLRAIHPNDHVTIVSPHSVQLLEWSKNGHAKCTLDRTDDQYVSLRMYIGTSTRLEGGDGTLDEDISFGLYTLEWEGETFAFYSIEWPEDGCLEHFYYILTPKAQNVDGQSPSADRLIKACGKWTRDLHEEIYVFDAGRWIKNKSLWTSVQHASWDDVILDPAMKQTLIRDVQGFFNSRQVYEEYSVPWKRGIIMHGTPGCGKTISIKALMNSLQAKSVASLYVKSFDSSNGSQYSIRSIFSMARNMAPCLLVFEDLDSLVKDELRSYFLNEVDGLEDNNGILMIGSTNHLERLDPGISKRPSRFDRKYHYKLPGDRERVHYAQYWQRKLEKNGKIDFDDGICDVVAKLTEGFSFAYMKELFVQALLAIVGGRSDDDEDDEEEGATAVEKAAQATQVVSDSSRLARNGESTGSTKTTKVEGEIREAGEDNKAAVASAKRSVPEVEVPEHLRSNPFLQVLRKQVLALVRDMNNTEATKTELGGKVKVVDEELAYYSD